MTVSSTTTKVSYAGNGATTVFAYTFKIFAAADLEVVLRSAAAVETVQTITTHYTVSGAGADAGGNVTFVAAPASGVTVIIRRALALTQGTDYVENDPFPANSHEDALDRLTFITQQMQEELDRSIKASVTNTISTVEFSTSAADRANKVFSFDSSGNLQISQELGTYRGNWSASTLYYPRDIIKDTSNNNIYLANTQHTSTGAQPISSNADVAKWDLIVDASAAATSATNAANSATAAATSATNAATSASNAATSETNAGTSETNAASSASAASTSATNASNSASAASTSASNASTSETNAASSASAASTSATNAASSASAASTSATNASNSASAASTSASNAATSETNAAASAASAEAAAASVYWNFDTSTTMADPGTGDVRFNNATIASVTQVAVSASSASTGNPDVSDFVAAWDDSTSTTKGYIVIREAGAPGTTIVFAISGTITDNTTWLQIPVTHVSSAGTLSASDDLYFSFSRTGDAGSAGPGSGDMLAASNLSDVVNAATARSNLSAAASGANTDITSLALGDGSSGAPALSFNNDIDTGFYRAGANSIGVVLGGTEELTLNLTKASALDALGSVMSSTATAAAQRAALGLDTGDSPQFTNLSLQGYFPNSFTLEFFNFGGTLQHAMYPASLASADSVWAGGINAQNYLRQTTPTGTDSSTAFAYGGKIQSAANSNFIFDTAVVADTMFGICALGYNSTATAGIVPQLILGSGNVNGVTRNRLKMRFTTSAGDAHDLNTTNIANTKFIQVSVLVWLPVYA
jgi:hypothetical protein